LALYLYFNKFFGKIKRRDAIIPSKFLDKFKKIIF